MLKVYVDSASVERLKCGRPGEGTVRNTLAGVRQFQRWMEEREKVKSEKLKDEVETEEALASIVKPRIVHKYLADMLKRGVRPVTAMSYLNQLQQLFAKWVRPYYEDRGWKVPPFPSLGGRPKAARYQRPAKEQLEKVKKWYGEISEKVKVKSEKLWSEELGSEELGSEKQDRNLWFVATMMLEFAMRNSDVMRLRRENFIEKDGTVYLNYTPHKTENSSGRMVKWPIHPDIWAKIKDMNFDYDEDTFRELNRQMRGLGFKGSKGAYELRKICVDHVYQRYGAEMATSISGDDIKTIIRYYADPAQPNIGAVRIVDLL